MTNWSMLILAGSLVAMMLLVTLAAPGKPVVPVFGRVAEWVAFRTRNARFIRNRSALRDAMTAAMNASLTDVNNADLVLYFHVHLCAEDFEQILLLAENGYGYGAMKLLRGLYERVVTARYLAKHPEETDKFVDWEEFSKGKLASAILKAFGDSMTPEQKAHFQKDVDASEALRPQFRVTDCRKCKTTRTNNTWAKVNFVEMAKDAGEETATWLGPAYYEPLEHAHANFRAIDLHIKEPKPGTLFFDHGPQRAEADRVLELAHLLMLNALELVISHLSIDEAKPSFELACAAFKRSWPAKDRATGPDTGSASA